MAIDREAFLATLEDSFSAYYNIVPNEDETRLPLAFRADYYSRNEKYWLTKSVKIWGNETNEFAYIFAAPTFDAALVDDCIDYVLAEALPRVKPHKEHQYTNFKAIFIADSFDEAARKAVTRRSFSKSYHFSLHGYSTLLTAAVDLSEEKTVTNKAGYELVKYFRKLFGVRKGND